MSTAVTHVWQSGLTSLYVVVTQILPRTGFWYYSMKTTSRLSLRISYYSMTLRYLAWSWTWVGVRESSYQPNSIASTFSGTPAYQAQGPYAKKNWRAGGCQIRVCNMRWWARWPVGNSSMPTERLYITLSIYGVSKLYLILPYWMSNQGECAFWFKQICTCGSKLSSLKSR